MAKLPTITLAMGTEYVLTSEIPLLIADALYPEANFLKLPIIDLYKIVNGPARPTNLLRRLIKFPPIQDWYSPLSDEDRRVLKSIWFHLPELKFPIPRKDWKPYAEAFSECGTEVGFDIKEDCVEWFVEPNGCQQHFFEQNNHSHNILGMWMNDDVEDSKLILKCGMAEMQHIVMLLEAIVREEVKQLDPITHAPTEIYRPFGKISTEEFIVYAQRFKISVRVKNDEVTINPEHSPEIDEGQNSPTPKNGFSEDEHEGRPATSDKSEVHHDGSSETNIPGKMPKVGIRKLAIKAAWQIECVTKKLATSKQVIEMLQSWVEGDYPELLEKIPYGVKWVTGKGEERYFDKEACGKALDTWQKSRQ